MNAVNLAPSAGRRAPGATPLADSAPLLGLLGGLVLVLLATFMFVSGHDRVRSRRAQLAHTRAAAQRWSTAAAAFSADVNALHTRSAQIQTVRGLAGTRYNWSLLFGQLAGLMPKDTALSAMSATDVPAATTEASGAAGAASSATTGSGISLNGCATSQDAVADAMVALRKIQGVSLVSLSQSSRGASSTGSSSSCAPGLAVSFQVTLSFAPATEGGVAQSTSDAASTTTTSSTGEAQ